MPRGPRDSDGQRLPSELELETMQTLRNGGWRLRWSKPPSLLMRAWRRMFAKPQTGASPRVTTFYTEQTIVGLRYPPGRYQITRLGPLDETEDVTF